MNKEVKKAQAMLTEKNRIFEEQLAKAEAEKAETAAKLADVTKALENAKGAEEYKKLVAEKRDYEAVLEFCNKNINNIKKASLSQEDYQAISGTVKAAYEAAKKEQLAAILEESKKLTKLFEAFEADVSELNEIAKQAAVLRGTTPTVILTQSEYSKDTNTRFYHEAYAKILKTEFYKAKGIDI